MKYLLSTILCCGVFACTTPAATNSATESSAGIQPTDENVTFRAQGNEPFWSVEFTNKRMTLSGLNIEPYSVPVPELTLAQDAEVYAYRSLTDAGELIVTLFPGNCDDTMADASYAFKSQVSFRPKDKQRMNYEGCGDFALAEPLDGDWKVLSLNGNDVGEKQEAPTLTFDVVGSKVMGTTGCNRYNGSFEMDKEARTLVPGPLASTKMMCEPGNLEPDFLQVMGAGELRYRVLPGTILLYAGDGGRMVLGR